VITEYREERPSRPIPQIPYVETGNAGERGSVVEPDEGERVAGEGVDSLGLSGKARGPEVDPGLLGWVPDWE
jgi:hypothetical protein